MEKPNQSAKLKQNWKILNILIPDALLSTRAGYKYSKFSYFVDLEWVYWMRAYQACVCVSALCECVCMH